MARLITAALGSAHITPRDDAQWHMALTGLRSCGFGGLEPEIVSNNTVRINDGVGMVQGVFFTVLPSAFDEVSIASGSQNVNRIDLICAKITDNGSTQSFAWEVVQGTPSSGEPAIPTYSEGDLDAGSTVGRYAFAKVNIEGVNITSVESYGANFGAAGALVALVEELAEDVSILESAVSTLQSRITPVDKGGTGASNGRDGLKNLLAAGSMILAYHQYGTGLPVNGLYEGRLFFKVRS